MLHLSERQPDTDSDSLGPFSDSGPIGIPRASVRLRSAVVPQVETAPERPRYARSVPIERPLRLYARSARVEASLLGDAPTALMDLLPGAGSDVAFVRLGDGFVGSGCVLRRTFETPQEADAWWSGLEFEHDDAALGGSSAPGVMAFGQFVFDPRHSAADAVLQVPEWVVGRRGDVVWVTRIATEPITAPPAMPTPGPPRRRPGAVTYADGSLSAIEWERRVQVAIERIRAGELEKAVLAREMVATGMEGIDARHLAANLATSYERCWTAVVDGWVGASPEMLVRRRDGLVTSRVLAGTIQRTSEADADRALATHLARSSKDLGEHEYAVASVAEALEPWCSGMNVPDAPYVLELPNVFHLASDVTGVAKEGATSLGLAAALHPSAAVCGTPTDLARDLIAEIEGLDRGRYAAPIGWIDASGDGEWAIALRGGRIDGDQAHLYAGCGIVADSVPADELAESNAKLIPMREALEG